MTKIWKQPPEVFYKKGALKNFSKFTGKLLCQSLLFNKIPGLSKFLKNPLFTEHLFVTASGNLKYFAQGCFVKKNRVANF